MPARHAEARAARQKDTLYDEVLEVLRAPPAQTPERVLFTRHARRLFTNTQRALERVAAGARVPVVAGYSIKTNPLTALVDLARDTGLWAEAIAQTEAAHALRRGFPSHQIILNGPAKWWPMPLDVPGFGAIFCDSMEELRMVTSKQFQKKVRADFIGVRLRPGTVKSRFGIGLSDPKVFLEVVRTLKHLPKGQGVGFHFHQASSMLGVRTWNYLALNFLAAITMLMERIGPRPLTISFGGGWHPDEWANYLNEILPSLLGHWRDELPTLQRVIVEPGKALSQPSMGVVMRVLEVRKSREGTDVVVDGSVAEVTDVKSHHHRIMSVSSSGKPTLWTRGNDRLLGRLCMEFDIVADGVKLPPGLKRGDAFCVLDAGAYDASMGYVFGRGDVHQAI